VVPGGWDNRTFRIGDDLAARLPSACEYAAAVGVEQQWLSVLGSQLPLQTPELMGCGKADDEFPWPWSIYRWIDGEPIREAEIRTAEKLAEFLCCLRAIDTKGGPTPSARNFFRGGLLSAYDGEVRSAIAALGTRIDGLAAARLWDAALGQPWSAPPVWVHGDVSPGNLLQRDGQLSAVIDFGQLAIGDPACDLVIAWTLFSGENRKVFRSLTALDSATWARAMAWALWKALIIAAGHAQTNAREWSQPFRVIDDLLTSES